MHKDPQASAKGCLAETISTFNSLDEYFSHLTPFSPDLLLGRWQGEVVPNQSIFESLLTKIPGLAWYGKEFINPDRVNALVMQINSRTFALPFIGSASLRTLEFRGKMSTAMIYDYLPIIDHFRKVDEDTVFGIMTLKGRTEVYFILHRDTKHSIQSD